MIQKAMSGYTVCFNDQCPMFRSDEKVRWAKGMTNIFADLLTSEFVIKNGAFAEIICGRPVFVVPLHRENQKSVYHLHWFFG